MRGAREIIRPTTFRRAARIDVSPDWQIFGTGRAIFLLTRRRVFHFARLRNRVKNSSGTLAGAPTAGTTTDGALSLSLSLSSVSICLRAAADFRARAPWIFHTENERVTFGNEKCSATLFLAGQFLFSLRSFFFLFFAKVYRRDARAYGRAGNTRKLITTFAHFLGSVRNLLFRFSCDFLFISFFAEEFAFSFFFSGT